MYLQDSFPESGNNPGMNLDKILPSSFTRDTKKAISRSCKRTPNCTNNYFLALVLTWEKPSVSFEASNSSIEEDALFE